MSAIFARMFKMASTLDGVFGKLIVIIQQKRPP